MKKNSELDLSPAEAFSGKDLKTIISFHARIPEERIKGIKLLKRSIDARKGNIRVHHIFDVYIDEIAMNLKEFVYRRNDVSSKKRILIIGAGPAGLFSALKLIELGYKPIIIDRGKSVENRKHDIAAIARERMINENSNYCFGEGGAGA